MVRPGQSWYYRVIAKNEAGSSGPSNTVGPVRVKQVCLADELKEFTLLHDHSDELILTNARNSYRGEYLYRVVGEPGQWLVYEAPVPVREVRLVAWEPSQAPGFEVSASPEGTSYRPLQVRSGTEEWDAYSGQRIVEVRLTAEPPADCRFIRIRWLARAELDRVELYCGGP
jgi:hypothetical protein